MTTPDNRALWELVEKWREKERTSRGCGDFCDGIAHGYEMCADAIQEILERPVEVGDGEVRLWDTQWMNIVNHDKCYRDWSKDDAIAHAVKMTEESIARNVADGKLPPRKDALESMVRGKS